MFCLLQLLFSSQDLEMCYSESLILHLDDPALLQLSSSKWKGKESLMISCSASLQNGGSSVPAECAPIMSYTHIHHPNGDQTQRSCKQKLTTRYQIAKTQLQGNTMSINGVDTNTGAILYYTTPQKFARSDFFYYQSEWPDPPKCTRKKVWCNTNSSFHRANFCGVRYLVLRTTFILAYSYSFDKNDSIP